MFSTIDLIKKVKYISDSNIVQTIYASKLSGLVSDLLAELGTKSKKTPLSKDIYEAIQFGNWYESMLISHYKELGILKYPNEDGQISVIQGIVKGKIDAVIEYEGKTVIVECKTKKELPQAPLTEHLYQLCYYMAYFPCDFGILHYADYNRNAREFIIKNDDPLIQKVKDKVEKINKHYNGEALSSINTAPTKF